ncbi:hypothetical protein [Corallococcus sp. EGB]|uniref:hypothetical protein n=1 Tax=Corallococcus sp. EGB TaxID=1521117 RepID=UPI001CBF7C67|nr:hypothetical protein [Corallococcus sp. EGB]
MALGLFKERGVPVERQAFTWKDLVRRPYSKLDDDAFTRTRVILMNGIEADAVRMKHSFALYDRLEGSDPNNFTQSYTDIIPGRPTAVEHRHPLDDVRRAYDRKAAHPLSKLHAMTITASEFMTHDCYMTVGPTFTDPVARQLYTEITSIEEPHVTQCGSLVDPDQSLLEQWMLHEGALSKLDVFGSWDGGPSRELLTKSLEDELSHFALLKEALEKLGADPTVMTPSADLTSVISMGVPAAISDARTNLRQATQALLVAELTDRFQQALDAEAEHLALVKGWLAAGVATEARAPMESASVPVQP